MAYETKKLKPAKIIYGKADGDQRKVTLRGGKNGRGRIIQSVLEWPWSPQSRAATEDILDCAAEREGYFIVAE